SCSWFSASERSHVQSCPARPLGQEFGSPRQDRQCAARRNRLAWSMIRRDARLRRGCTTQGDDQRQQRETVSRAPHAGCRLLASKIKDYSVLKPVTCINWPHRLWSASMMRRILLGLLVAASIPSANKTFCPYCIALLFPNS